MSDCRIRFASWPSQLTSDFTQDEDLLGEATRRQRNGVRFPGVIYAHQLRVTVGQCIRDLELMATLGHPSDIADRIEFLPL